MKFNQFFTICCTGLLLVASFPLTFVNAADSSTDLPDFPTVSSDYVVLMDADSGEVLYANNANEKCYPASTTKLLTGLLTIENKSLSDVVTFSQDAVNSVDYGDANAAITTGEELTVEQALYSLILRSANDVAYGLGEAVGGSIPDFATMMNARAEELGALNTHFTNPSGLHDDMHYTTPYDMALIAKACFNNKSYMKIISYSDVYTIGPTNTSNFTRYYSHRYQMLPNGEHPYAYSLGGKTGFTDEAGYCLVSFAQKGDLRLICVVLKSTDEERYADTEALFDYYFLNYKKIYFDDLDTGLGEGNLDILKLTTALDASANSTVGFEDGAYLLVPKAAEFSDLTSLVTYSDNPAYTGKEGGFACISYYYRQLDVGSATVFIQNQTASSDLPGSNGVPKASSDNTLNLSKNIFYINIWYVLGGLVAIGLITLIVFYLIKRRGRRHHYGSRHLHF